MKLINLWDNLPNRLEHAFWKTNMSPLMFAHWVGGTVFKICMLGGRGCLYFALFSSLNKALCSCGLLHKSCLLLHSWYAHVTMLWVTVSLMLREQPKTKCLSDRMSGVHHRQEMKFIHSANTATVCFTKWEYFKNKD